MTNRIYIFSAAVLLAGCSSAAQEATNTIFTAQGGPVLASTYDVAPPAAPLLDGAPSAPAPIEPAPVVPPAQLRAPEPLPPPVTVQRVKASFTCDIDVDRTSNGIRITPVVRANKSLSGEYTLVITKTGGGGSSDISQGGPFDATRGKSVRLGSSEFSMERGAKFRAVLKVRADGREVCRDFSS